MRKGFKGSIGPSAGSGAWVVSVGFLPACRHALPTPSALADCCSSCIFALPGVRRRRRLRLSCRPDPAGLPDGLPLFLSRCSMEEVRGGKSLGRGRQMRVALATTKHGPPVTIMTFRGACQTTSQRNSPRRPPGRKRAKKKKATRNALSEGALMDGDLAHPRLAICVSVCAPLFSHPRRLFLFAGLLG